jgi:hypothetical protein
MIQRELYYMRSNPKPQQSARDVWRWAGLALQTAGAVDTQRSEVLLERKLHDAPR